MVNPSNFRGIELKALLYETLSGFLSLNKALDPTWLYKFCAACLVIMDVPLTDFYAFRNKEYLIANCKWQVGQLQNVLNFLYDKVQNRIIVAQSIAHPEFLMEFGYAPEQFLSEFEEDPIEFWREFNDGTASSSVIISIPVDADLVDLTATVAQIAMEGVPYKIVVQ